MVQDERVERGGTATWGLIAVGIVLVAVGTAATSVGGVILVVAVLQARGPGHISNTVVPQWGIADAIEGWIALGVGAVILCGAVLAITRGVNRRFAPVEYGPRRSSATRSVRPE